MPHMLITGANRGIGLEHTRVLLSRGWHVSAACRNPDKASDLKALDPGDGRLKILAYDAGKAGAADALKAEVSGPIDILFANAGVFGPNDQSFGNSDFDAITRTLQVNAIAPLKLAEAFADQVAKSQLKVMALQSSRMGSIADNTSGGYYAYRASKAALNAIGRSLSVDLKPKGIITLIFHPGWVKTDMGGAGGTLTVNECVEGQLDLIARANPAMNGRFFHVSGEDLDW
ncbi:SDR family oxidoreductase [Glycocaulis abyssi]|uniref:SDR family oxidoreductase n=1 Tax=Glycocaulis abyssi TaxID=1433403 RepID=A0ABV9NC01_9PROT